MPDNPFAFPQPVAAANGAIFMPCENHSDFAGMELRDYFAGQALVGLIHHYHEDRAAGHEPLRELAELSYSYADHMLAAREKGGA
jgi:hypothetical protein